MIGATNGATICATNSGSLNLVFIEGLGGGSGAGSQKTPLLTPPVLLPVKHTCKCHHQMTLTGSARFSSCSEVRKLGLLCGEGYNIGSREWGCGVRRSKHCMKAKLRPRQGQKGRGTRKLYGGAPMFLKQQMTNINFPHQPPPHRRVPNTLYTCVTRIDCAMSKFVSSKPMNIFEKRFLWRTSGC